MCTEREREYVQWDKYVQRCDCMTTWYCLTLVPFSFKTESHPAWHGEKKTVDP